MVAKIQKDTAVVEDRTLATPVQREALRFPIRFVGDSPLNRSLNAGPQPRHQRQGSPESLGKVHGSNSIASVEEKPHAIFTGTGADEFAGISLVAQALRLSRCDADYFSNPSPEYLCASRKVLETKFAAELPPNDAHL